MTAPAGRSGFQHRTAGSLHGVSRPATTSYVALAALDTALAATGRTRARRLTKPLLMPLLMVGRDRPTRRAVTLSGAGDVALLGTTSTHFRAGLGSFLAGHVAWVAALRVRSKGHAREHPGVVATYLLVWLALNGLLWRRTGRGRVPVVLYSVAIIATALAALDTGNPTTAAGGALFLSSDAAHCARQVRRGRDADAPGRRDGHLHRGAGAPRCRVRPGRRPRSCATKAC